MWGCGYLAQNEADLDDHELACEHETATTPPCLSDELADAVIDLGRLALAFGRINRTAVYHPDQVTPESDSDHTVMLGWVACALAAHWFPHLDVGLVAQYALVHDAVEVYAGDTPTLRISTAERAAKASREHQASQRLLAEFGSSLPWFPTTITTYEARQSPEARFVCGVDKVLPKVVHLLDGCVGLTDRHITAAELAALFGAQRQDMAGYLGEFADLLDLHAALADRVIARPELATVRADTTRTAQPSDQDEPDTVARVPGPRLVGSLHRSVAR